MAYNRIADAKELRLEIDALQRRIDMLTSGSVVSACQHRTARQMEEENRLLMTQLDTIEGRVRPPFKEPAFVLSEAKAARLERLPAGDKNAALAKEVLARPDRMITGREARLLGIGR